MVENSNRTKAVVVHAGGRDRYQLALALQQCGVLDKLFTNFYWHPSLYNSLKGILPYRLIPPRICSGLDYHNVRQVPGAVVTDLMRQIRKGPQDFEASNRLLGHAAQEWAVKNERALFSYSYYGHASFDGKFGDLKYKFLFQLHPHHRSVRSILAEELELRPEGKESLMAESELKLPTEQFESLANEPNLANGWVAASSYTARTMVENGIPAERIHIVPYGVDLTSFLKRSAPPAKGSDFTVVYVGSFVQRKGLIYLLEALRLLKSHKIRLLLRGKNMVDLELLSNFRDVEVDVKIGLPEVELVRDIQSADMFVLPSLTEGFAHVILEAMACGLPILTTANTCAEDVLQDGKEGFVVPIRDPNAIAEKIQWGLDNRVELAHMGDLASIRAREFTWERFRSGIGAAYTEMIDAINQNVSYAFKS